MTGLQIRVKTATHHATGEPEWRAEASLDGDMVMIGFGKTQLAAVSDLVEALRSTVPGFDDVPATRRTGS